MEREIERIVLIGFMGSGKSTVGRCVAERVGLAFVDLDAEIERHAGRTVAEIFAAEGEAGFRVWEGHVADAYALQMGVVIATGGGAWGRAETRAGLGARALVVHLQVTVDAVLARLGAGGGRPLLAGAEAARTERVQALMAARAALYAQAAWQVDTTGRTVAVIAEEIERLWQKNRKRP